MKFTAVVSLSLVSLAAAAGLEDIPKCAAQCLTDAVTQSTSCTVSDVSCICKSFDKVQGAAAGCILAACGQDEALNKVLPASQNLCSGAAASSSGGSSRPTSPSKPSPSVTVVPPPANTQPSQAPTPTAGAAAFAPMGGLAMLALGLLAL